MPHLLSIDRQNPLIVTTFLYAILARGTGSNVKGVNDRHFIAVLISLSILLSLESYKQFLKFLCAMLS